MSFSERGNRELQKECDNNRNNNDQPIYAYIARMSDNDEFPGRDFSDSPQLTNWILDSVPTCIMTPQISDFIPGLLEDTDKNIEFVNGHHVTAK